MYRKNRRGKVNTAHAQNLTLSNKPEVFKVDFCKVNTGGMQKVLQDAG